MVDVIASVSSAIHLATRLREESQSLGNTTIRNLLSELSAELDTVRRSIAAILPEKPETGIRLQPGPGEACERCPDCGNFTLGMTACRPHPIFGDIGGKDREFKCSACGFSESRYVDL